jgi:hypothetical protein
MGKDNNMNCWFRSSSFEELEPRHTMSGISAVLQRDGVLSITATDREDTITLDSTLTTVKLVETAQKFHLSRIRAIEAVLGGGNDTVIHKSSATGITPWAEIPMRLESVGGSDSFRGVNGRTVYFGGSEDTLTVDRRGHIKIDGHRPDWFDYHVPQNAVGILARELVADKILSFNEMVRLLRFAALTAGENAVGSKNFAALRAIIRHDAFFHDLDYVQALSGYVVFPSKANRYFVEFDSSSGDYVERRLGNLSSGSTGDKLGMLVDKWFLGLDRPIPHSQEHPIERTEYRAASGSLFKASPTLHQIHQGGDGDCYFMSSLGAILVHDPQAIEDMFECNQVDGKSVYTVRFYSYSQGGKAYYVTVDTQLPVISSGPYAGYFAFDDSELKYNDSRNVLWSAYAEKAYVQLCQFGWSRGDRTRNSYESIRGGSAAAALEQLTGQRATSHNFPTANTHAVSYKALIAAFASGRPVALSTKDPSGSQLIVRNHVYAMVGYAVGTNPGEVKILLFNPWGFGDPEKPGLIWRTWSEILHSFDGWAAGMSSSLK